VTSGIYTAYSGLRAQMEAIDLLANNLANLSTVGYKEGKAFFTLLQQNMNSDGAQDLTTVVNSQAILAHGAVNPADGSLLLTNRDLDVALVGNGFLTLQAPQGTRYTRNGSLMLNHQSMLATSQGFPVVGESGRPITLGPGKVHINEGGEVFLDGTRVDRMKIAAFDSPAALEMEGNSLLKASLTQAVKAGDAKVQQGYLEQSNVDAMSAVVKLVEIMRQYESIQKTVNLMMNTMDTKSIERLGR
jgi:flagellar basal-body rod protein FlgF